MLSRSSHVEAIESQLLSLTTPFTVHSVGSATVSQSASCILLRKPCSTIDRWTPLRASMRRLNATPFVTVAPDSGSANTAWLQRPSPRGSTYHSRNSPRIRGFDRQLLLSARNVSQSNRYGIRDAVQEIQRMRREIDNYQADVLLSSHKCSLWPVDVLFWKTLKNVFIPACIFLTLIRVLTLSGVLVALVAHTNP